MCFFTGGAAHFGKLSAVERKFATSHAAGFDCPGIGAHTLPFGRKYFRFGASIPCATRARFTHYPVLAVGGRFRFDTFVFFILASEQATLEKQLWEARAITEDPDFGGKEFLISSSKSAYEKVASICT